MCVTFKKRNRGKEEVLRKSEKAKDDEKWRAAEDMSQDTVFRYETQGQSVRNDQGHTHRLHPVIF